MIAKRLTRSQNKVADESCSFRAPSRSGRVETKSKCNREGNHGGTPLQHVVRDDSIVGDSSSVTDLTDTPSVGSLDRATSAPSPSLKSCLSSGGSTSDLRRDYSKNRHVSFDSIEIRRYPVSQMSIIRTVLASLVFIAHTMFWEPWLHSSLNICSLSVLYALYFALPPYTRFR